MGADAQASLPNPAVAREPGSRWQTEVISTRAGLEKLANEWNTLQKESAAGTLFLSWEWVSTWLSTVHPEASLFVPVVRDREGRLAALAPFYLSKLQLLGLLNYRCLRLLGDVGSGAEYPDLLMRVDIEEEVLPVLRRLMLEHRNRWDCLWLRDIAEHSGAFDRFRRLFDGPEFYFNHRPRDLASVALPDTYEAYEMSLSRRHRTNTRRHAKMLSADHSVELVGCQTDEDIAKLLPAFFDLHRQRWRRSGQAGSFDRQPRAEGFFEQFSRVALAKGWLRLLALKVGGEIQAVQYGYAENGCFYSVQEGYLPEGSPGMGNVLRKFVIEACIDEGIGEYDFLGGYSDHKRHWGAVRRAGQDLFVGRRTPKNWILFRRKIWPTGRHMRQNLPSSMPVPVPS